MRNQNLQQLLNAQCGEQKAGLLFDLLQMPAIVGAWEPRLVTRVELAQAMNMALFGDIIDRVPSAHTYVSEVQQRGGSVCFDHGALRTVRWVQNGALPPGEAAFTRILKPLGYKLNGRYPLDRLKMTGRSYAHEDAPDEIAQFFVSELHPEYFSEEFQQAVSHVLDSSRDPLTPLAFAQLSELDRDGCLPLDAALQLLPVLVRCFDRQHGVPTLADYETLLRESAEMAWIATEGNAFNHATDRVPDVEQTAAAQKALGRAIKESVEVSKSKRVLQTAFQADPVQRDFIDRDGLIVSKTVPGSFYEFITRRRHFDRATRCWLLDLGFDAGNAQQIFKMTAAA